VKAIVAACSKNADWTVVRPPLIALGNDQQGSLMAALDHLDFAMPGIG
jgi:hypothetical protein